MPGGKVDADDASILVVLGREVAEEAGLVVMKVKSALSPFMFTTEKTVKDEAGEDVVVERHAFQLSYVVSVRGDSEDFVVNEGEHSMSVWAVREDLDGLPMTSGMKTLVEEAFGVADVVGSRDRG